MSEQNQVTDKQFLGVRQAFRLLEQFQKTVTSIVYYIRDCSVYKKEHKIQDIYALVWYKNLITKTYIKNQNCKVPAIKIIRDDWAWSYLPCYFVEHVLGDEKIDEKYKLRFSIFQVSDDGSFVSDWNFTSDFKPAEKSESWLIFSGELYAVDKESKLWLRKSPQNETEYPDRAQDTFINEFIFDKADVYINANGELDDVFVIKKYKMSEFSGRDGIDGVIKDFAQLMYDISKEKKIFLDRFYQ